MLSTDYKFIFIHIPKTAGTSITSTLSALRSVRFPRFKEMLNFPSGVRSWRAEKHEKASSIRNKIGENQYARFYKFTVVRNPWDLMVSSYHWWTQNAIKYEVFDQDTQAILAGNGFNDFIRSRYGSCMINEFRGNELDWVSDARGKIIVDYIARYEQLDKDWIKICDILAIPYSPLPKENASARTHYRDYYTDETRKLVAWRFGQEIEMFQYAF